MFMWLWSRGKDKPRGEPPKFVVPLQPLQVKHGEKVVLEATVRGQPTPRVLWYHLDKEIAPSPEFVQEHDTATGRVSLTINEIFIDDKGLYRCVAVNEFGRDETASYITVEDIEMLEKCELRQAPRITVPLQAQVVKTHSSLDLLARYEAFPPPTIKWYHQGKELKPSRDFIIEHTDDETTLHIEEIFEDDCGEYEVRIFNEAGEARSLASVVVLKPLEAVDMEPPKFIKPLQPQIVPEGEVAILETEVTAKPEAQFQWYRHGQEIIHDEELEVQITSENNKSTLVLGELFEDDSGDYTVAAMNPVGRAASTATLLVEGEGAEEAIAPVITMPLTPIRVMDGEEVRFSCKVTGKPMPKLSWFQNGRPIGHQREVRLTQTPQGLAGLQILEVFPEDAGDYTCIARNKAGEARTTANLTVESYEYIPDSEAATVTSVSEKNVFSGSPSEEDETMEIEKDSESDSSEAGSSPYFCNRLEQKIEVMEGTSVRLLAKANGYPRPTIKWYVDGTQVEVTEALTDENYEDGTAALTLHKTTLDDCGVYTCEAMNRNGIDTTVTTLVVLPEHTEATSKAYRKPEWVSRMEELKEQMSGIVERSRARRIGSRLQQTSSLKPSVVLQQSQSLLQSTPSKLKSTSSMSQSTTSVYQCAPLLHSTPIMIQSSPCVLQALTNVSDITPSPVIPFKSAFKEVQPVLPVTLHMPLDSGISSHVNRGLMSSVDSSSATSMSIDSLERPSVSRDPSCMSSRDTISECDTEYGSHTDIECKSDTEYQGERLAHLEAASSISIGDLSMGSDSVFVSENETVSEGTSRRPSGYTINPIYLTQEQALSISKSSLLSPNTKHVHFKFDANTPSTTSEDEKGPESTNFAQAVMTDYLSSHRNSISQVIEALSSLAQADITAEIEMTIEQNKKDKQINPDPASKPGSAPDINLDFIPAIEIIEPSPDATKSATVLQNLSTAHIPLKPSTPGEMCKEGVINSDTCSLVHSLETVTPVKKDLCVSPDATGLRDRSDKTENVEMCSQRSVLGSHEDVLHSDNKDTRKSKNLDLAEMNTNSKTSSNNSGKAQRKSILKNSSGSGETSSAQREDGCEAMKENKVTRQLTPTLRRKPILTKENMVSSSVKPIKKEPVAEKTATSRRYIKEPMEDTMKVVSRSLRTVAKPTNACTDTQSPVDKKPDVQRKMSGEKTKTLRTRGQEQTQEEIETNSEASHFLSISCRERSSSAPTTPLLMRKQRPSPPCKLPLVLSRESSTDSLKESRIPRFKSNDSTPISTPKQARKFAFRNEEASTKIPNLLFREHSSDSLSGLPGLKRNVWSEPSSPMSTPQLIRKTFKQIHESSKIPMPVYQYSSTEDLEDSSPDSPRASRQKCQRSLIRPPQAMSVDRAMELTLKTTDDESPKPSRTPSRTQSPLPVSPRMHSSIPSRVQSPQPLRNANRVQSPVINRIGSPIPGKLQISSQPSSRVTSPGSTPRTVISPGSTPKTVISPSSTPKGLQSPDSTPKTFQSPTSTPKRVESPLPGNFACSISDSINKTGARPKISRASLFTVKESSSVCRTPQERSSSCNKYMSASDSEQHYSPLGSGRTKSSRSSRNGNMRRADSLEEFLLLENECMD